MIILRVWGHKCHELVCFFFFQHNQKIEYFWSQRCSLSVRSITVQASHHAKNNCNCYCVVWCVVKGPRVSAGSSEASQGLCGESLFYYPSLSDTVEKSSSLRNDFFDGWKKQLLINLLLDQPAKKPNCFSSNWGLQNGRLTWRILDLQGYSPFSLFLFHLTMNKKLTECSVNGLIFFPKFIKTGRGGRNCRCGAVRKEEKICLLLCSSL